MEPAKNSDSSINLRLTSNDNLAIEVDRLMNNVFPSMGAKLEPQDFMEYGVIENGKFVPYWHEDETFEQFTQREVWLNRPVAQVVGGEAGQLLARMPISPEDKNKLPLLSKLFTSNEIDEIQSYAISIPNEMMHSVALAFEALGKIESGKVDKVVSPLEKLREEANDNVLEFGEEIKKRADGVYGYPDYPEPETSPDVVSFYKNQEVLPQEPEMIYASQKYPKVWAISIRGEKADHSKITPIVSLAASVQLVVLGEEKSRELMSIFLGKDSLLRYLLASRIVETQRKKMKDFEHLFTVLQHRKYFDNTPGEEWKFEKPARKPADSVKI